MNVKIAFLYDLIDEKVYMKQSSENKRNKKYACRLNKALYDLKQLFRMWYNIFVNFFRFFDFENINVDYNIFIDYKIKVIIEVCVNNLLIVEQFEKKIVKLKMIFKKRFYMKNINSYSYWLKFKIIRDRARRILQLNQTDYFQQILKKFDIWKFKQQVTFMNIFIKLIKFSENYQIFKKLKHRY